MNSLLLFKHELLISACLIVFVMLKLAKDIGNRNYILIAYLLLAINFFAGFYGNMQGVLFGSMFYTNEFIVVQKGILTLGVLLISLFSYRWLENHKHLPEFFMLLFASLLGLFLMISSGNLLMFYLALELSTLPLAALCNFDLDRKKSSEAAMKMILSSAFASGILLMGISLIYGATGTLLFSELPFLLNGSPLELFAFILLFSGFAFKLSVVPFHLWTADVYEGSPVAVTSFLSVISKGAMVFVFASVLLNVFSPLESLSSQALFISSILTMTVGNLFAIRQNNLKRFLAFSSVSQAGFILIALGSFSLNGVAASVYFILIYLFSNLAAFGVVGIVAYETGKENIQDYRGLRNTNPMLAWSMALALFSLAGIPPTAGFFGKFFLLAAGSAKGNFVLIAIAAVNMVISLYYYLRVVRAMFMDNDQTPLPVIRTDGFFNAAILICLTGILAAGIWDFPFQAIRNLSPFLYLSY